MTPHLMLPFLKATPQNQASFENDPPSKWLTPAPLTGKK